MTRRQQDGAGALRTRIETRVGRSSGLLKAMGTDYEAFLRVALNALVVSPDLAQCDPDSMDIAIVHALNLGLMPDGREAAIVRYKDRAQLMPMIEGRLKLARRAVPGIAIWARTVWEGDRWEHEEGLTPRLVHVPDPAAFDRKAERVRAVYAVARFPGGATEHEVLYRVEIDHFRAMSRARGGPWSEHYAEMGEKAVLGRLLKRLPRRAGEPDLPDEADLFGGATQSAPTPAAAPALEHLPGNPAPVVEATPAPDQEAVAARPARKKRAAKKAAPPADEPPPHEDADVPVDLTDDGGETDELFG